MPPRIRPVDAGTIRGRDIRVALGREIRDARIDRGLTLRGLGRAVGLSAAECSRIERGLIRGVAVHDLARMLAAVGLGLSARAYPGGQPIRDVAQNRLLLDFRTLLHVSLRWATEVPLPIAGDLRAWDGMITGPGWRYGTEAELAPRDAQALGRRIHLKIRDGSVDGAMLVLRSSIQTRRFLAEAADVLRPIFPVPGTTALEALRAGNDPGGSAIIVLPRR